MPTVPIHLAKSQLSELIRAVEQGEEVVLTRHGKRVIRLIREPDSEQPSIEARRQAIQAELAALREKVGGSEPSFRELWAHHKQEREPAVRDSGNAAEDDAGR
ncbi:MAG TPA: type II toxin-antitoxin system prevent-host-death family antitoxin [Ramlibacter sp.]|jgi:prevent-host-death family protein|uniref:type II toxin-antitoxin system Phd/YefM family antitoxin n=1 Tax=Ramlibacter sp. TaxID=1917967 RepID=UPI002D755C95|nr:type II toxin-antitoxin system prevent-host-death family antitoxin [Ramlibacter sp.]HZY18615.1 type II toxin-antitoxin system prevent-host-death family antitoxin [Ramlibacter sp.]